MAPDTKGGIKFEVDIVNQCIIFGIVASLAGITYAGQAQFWLMKDPPKTSMKMHMRTKVAMICQKIIAMTIAKFRTDMVDRENKKAGLLPIFF